MAVAEAKLERIAPPTAGPAPDRAPDWVAAGTPPGLRADLAAIVGAAGVLGRPIDLVRYATDASPYRVIPKAVVVARGAEDVAGVLAYGRRSGVPVTLRGGGTSLNGQGQSEGILVDVRRHFGGVAVEDGGERARVGPGTVLGHVNRVLAPLRRKLGPDPASTDIATVGGVVANNSGGMRCGVVRDSYSTVRSMTFVLPSGTTIDTGSPDAEERFAEAEPELAAGLAAIREEILADAGARRADPAQVRDQEHHGLPPLRLPRRRDAARDLPPPARRVRGNAGLPGRGRLRDRPRARLPRASPGSTSPRSRRRPSQSLSSSPQARRPSS